MFSGSMVAIVTPFKDGKVDYVALEKLVDWHVQCGTDAIVPCGTTGESPTLSEEEHRMVIRSVVEAAGGKTRVIAGTGSNDTRHAIAFNEYAARVGADAALTIVPYYNKPTQEGILEHFRAVAAATDLPLVLYNIPGRCGTGMTAETIVRAYEIPEVAAVKDATGGVATAMEVLSQCDIVVLSGDDNLVVPFMSIGAKGVISVVANVLPKEMLEMTHAMLDGDIERARGLQARLYRVCRVMFAETNPIGIKAALAMTGKIEPEIRPPMTRMTTEAADRLREVMTEFGLL